MNGTTTGSKEKTNQRKEKHVTNLISKKWSITTLTIAREYQQRNSPCDKELRNG